MIEEGALGDLPADLAQVVPLLRSKITAKNVLVDGMLDAARIDDEHLRLITAPTDVRDVVTHAVQQVAAM